jgi:hypothetical protein
MSVCRPLRRVGLVVAVLLLTLVPFVPALAQQEGDTPLAAPSEVPAPASVETLPAADTPAVAPVVPEPAPAPAPDVAAPLPADEPAAPAAATVAEPAVAPVAPPAEPVAPAATPAAAATESPAAAPVAPAAPAPALAAEVSPPAPPSPPATPWIDTSKPLVSWDRMNVLVIIAALLGFVTYFTMAAQRGREMFIRRISGLSALEDAVGRATEMGRGVLYIPGIMDMDDIQTIAGVTILGHVAKKTAEYETPLFAPMTRSFVMSVAQEVVKQSYLEKGRPDAFRADRINYLTDDQFGFVAGVGGIMMREKPAACFYLGTFYAESLILAETGNAVGAIQIAGTAEPSQIPFFVAACDYTLIGEELFAASAYLSRNPKEVGSLKGQDMGKLAVIFAIIVGTLLISVSQSDLGAQSGMLQWLSQAYMNLLK